jgi:predicted nucleic acid-binding protein
MRFWDTSALVPLLVEEPLSAPCRRLLRADRSIAVWTLTRLEMASAVHRKRRANELAATDARAALGWIDRLAERWTEVDLTSAVRERAERLLGLHPLRAADALQLAAALQLYRDQPRGRSFVTVDDELAAAAEREGFAAVVPAA